MGDSMVSLMCIILNSEQISIPDNKTSNTMQPAISIHNEPSDVPVLRVASPSPDNRTSNLPVLFAEPKPTAQGKYFGVEATEVHHATGESAVRTEGSNARRLRLIFEQEHDQADVFELFGWNDLPTTLRSAIRSDIEAYRDELLGLYSSCNAAVHQRRKRVSWWIYAYRNNLCTAKTAVNMLKTDALES